MINFNLYYKLNSYVEDDILIAVGSEIYFAGFIAYGDDLWGMLDDLLGVEYNGN